MAEAQVGESEVSRVLGTLGAVRRSVAQVIVGQQAVVDDLLVSLLAGGHCLLQGVPGLGKTLLLRTLGTALDLPFGRIQFTPDLMPGDIIGSELLVDDGDGGRRFEFQQGPVFTSLLLADEINRTPPKTQSALLEAMAERSVTLAGTLHELPDPFFVMATQNPLEQAGTYPLPEAQLDRFLLMIRIEYPERADEIEILARTTGDTQPEAQVAMTREALLLARRLVRQVPVSRPLLEYAAALVRATRPGTPEAAAPADEWIRWGAGPRAGQALVVAAKAYALLDGRLAVTEQDLQRVLRPVLRHRLILNYHAEAEHQSADAVIDELLAVTPPPADPLPDDHGAGQ